MKRRGALPSDVAYGPRFPRLYAAASLKRRPDRDLEQDEARFPRLYAAASLKPGPGRSEDARVHRFPRLYAAASLKL